MFLQDRGERHDAPVSCLPEPQPRVEELVDRSIKDGVNTIINGPEEEVGVSCHEDSLDEAIT